MLHENPTTSISTKVLNEAFRRAQLSGRVYPDVSDYPCGIRTREIYDVYQPFIEEFISQKESSILCINCPFEDCTKKRETKEEIETYGGDDIATVLQLADI